MGFEDYAVLLSPERKAHRWSSGDNNAFIRWYKAVQSRYPAIHSDDVEIAHLQYHPSPNQRFLVHEDSAGLFQILATADEDRSSLFDVSVRFAYCNPVSVYVPFCAFVEWLITEWDMSCYIMRDLAPEQEQEGIPKVVNEPPKVREVLIPSMDYNRHFWQLDISLDEAILRPGDAVARFVIPQLELYIADAS